MRTFDLTPLLRSSIGFDRMNRLLESAMRLDDSALAYPPYNIEKLSENDYRLTMAVAGFGEDDIEITAKENTLVIKGKAQADEDGVQVLHRGIGRRAFERRFDLAEHLEVKGASMANGLLNVSLVREIPEAMKPRSIAIGKPADAIESKAA